jgi:hypothetical protein
MIVDNPGNTMPRIGSVFAYLSKDKDGNEGVCAGPLGPGGMLVPLIAADPARLKAITPLAEKIAKATGMTIVLVEFTTRIDHREIKGNGDG